MEFCAVTFRMIPKAKIRQVKGTENTIRDWEEILRDAGERFNLERYKDGLDHWMWKLPNFKHKSDDQTS